MTKISSDEELYEALKYMPRDWGSIIATRVAMRVLPLVVGRSTPQRQLVYASVRATFISWVARKFPTQGMSFAARSAANAAVRYADRSAARSDSNSAIRSGDADARSADSAARSATRAAAYSASETDVGPTTRSAARSADSASYSADFTDSETIWSSIDTDFKILQLIASQGGAMPQLVGKALWLDEGGIKSQPEWSMRASADFMQFLLEENIYGNIWADWYQSILNGDSVWGLNAKQEEEICVYIALQENAFWERDFKDINIEISGWIEEAREKQNSVKINKIFVSYSEKDEEFAHWIVSVIDRAGVSAVVQYRDFQLVSDFVREIRQGVDNSDKMIAVVSPDYEKSNHCQNEWAAFYDKDPGGAQRKLLPLLVRPTDLNSLSKQIVYSRIYDLSADQAKRKILDAIGFKGDVETPENWPGARILNDLRGSGSGVFNVQPQEDGRLRQSPTTVREDNISGFTPEQIFEDMKDQADDLCQRLQIEDGNQFYSADLKYRAKNWADILSKPIEMAKPLALNSRLVWLLRILAFDVRQGNLASSDQVRLYVSQLQVSYKRLEVIFPALKPYRLSHAHERFELPTDAENAAIEAVLDFFGDEQSAGDIFEELLIQGFQDVSVDRKDARQLPADDDSVETRNVQVEAEMDAGNRTVAVTRWLANADSLFKQGGKTADEAAKTIKKYDAAYKTLAPHLEKVFDYLSRWMF